MTDESPRNITPLEQPPEPHAPEPAPRRSAVFDILKAIGILEVMTHHLLSFSMRKYTEPGAWDWWLMAALNRILHFAVPTFLLASALLLARSIASKPRPDWKRYFARRAQRTLWPYLLWSFAYVLFRLYVVRQEVDLEATDVTVPLTDPGRLWHALLFGKAYFHLYFLVVLLQFALLFPVIYLFVRRARMGFCAVVALGAGLQLIAYFVQRHWLRLEFPSSTIFWYIPPALIGVWLGQNWGRWDEIWRRNRTAIWAAAAAGFALYAWWSWIELTGGRITSLPYNAGVTAYSTGVALLLLAWSHRLDGSPRLRGILQRVGDRSLALYLVHPMVLYLMAGPTITSAFLTLPLPPLWAAAVLFGVCWAFTGAVIRLRLSGLLFAR